MKRSFALLLFSLLLAVSLTACGKDRQAGDVTGGTNGGTVAGDTGSGAAGGAGSGDLTGDPADGGVNGNGGSLNGGTDRGGVNGSAGDSVTGGVNGGNGGSMMDGALDTMENAGDRARSAVQSADGRLGGYTYEQMVRNGRVF